MKILRLSIIFFVFTFLGCKHEMPEKINEKITVYAVSDDGFKITFDKNPSDDKILYDCYILNDDSEYYSILGHYVGVMKYKVGKINSESFFKKYKSAVKIYRTSLEFFDFINVNELESGKKYYIAVFEYNGTTNTIRRYELRNATTLPES